MKLILIRHGKTKFNEEGRYLGRYNESLCHKGKEDIILKKESGKYPKTEILASSPMKRCKETAKLIYEDIPLTIIEEWEEIDFGKFEGHTYEELKADEDYRMWLESNGKLPFPMGESREEFIVRCIKGLGKWYSLIEKEIEEKIAVAVVHGGTIMAILSTFTHRDLFDFQCKNGEGYCFDIYFDETIQIKNIKKL